MNVTNPGSLTAMFDLNQAPPGSGYRVRVTNPDGGTGICASTCFSIAGPVPTFTSVTPNTREPARRPPSSP